MILTRRAPWQKYWTGVGASDDAWKFFPERAFYQYSGTANELIKSRHVEFTPEDWRALLLTDYVEVVVLDEMVAYRARSSVLFKEQAVLRRRREEWHVVYLPVFRAHRLHFVEGF